MVKKTLITCALPYANGMIHMGHMAGAYLPADVYARFCRMRGDELLFLCGSDEYGMAISLSAQMARKSPKEHVDYFHELNKSIFEKLQISWDHYSRTSWPGHIGPSQQFFLDLLKNGYIEEKWCEQLYSPKEGRFLADRYVVGRCPKCGFDQARGDECPKCAASYEALDLIDPLSKLTGAALQRRQTKHWFLRLDLFKEPLLKWLEHKLWKPNVLNFVKPYIEDLRPRAITRDSDWGVPVPLEGAEGKVLYVWFDAPVGYISAAMDWASRMGDEQKWKEFWLDEQTELVQFMGKDNIPFHAVIFPAMIMGQDLPLKLVDMMPANEFYNLEGRKMSKSEGWYIDLAYFLEHYDAESLRYMIAATAPESSDSEFSWREFQSRVNAELVGKWSNFIHRTLSFVQKVGGMIPDCTGAQPSDHHFKSGLEQKAQEIYQAYSEFKLRRASQVMMDMAQTCNTYFDSQKPWQLLKEGQSERLNVVLYFCLEAIRILTISAHPILPLKTQQAWQMLGMPGQLSDLKWSQALSETIKARSHLPVPQILFTKIEDEQVQKEVHRLNSQHEAYCKSLQKPIQEPFVKEQVNIESFFAIDMRCAQVIEASKVPNSKKLLRLMVDMGDSKPRQVISNIGEHYEPEKLLGKRVVCIANLPKVTLMGLASEAMILAAADGKVLELVELSQVAVGARIK